MTSQQQPNINSVVRRAYNENIIPITIEKIAEKKDAETLGNLRVLLSEYSKDAQNGRKMGQNNLPLMITNLLSQENKLSIKEQLEFNAISNTLLCGMASLEAADKPDMSDIFLRLHISSLLALILAPSDSTSKSAGQALFNLIQNDRSAKNVLLRQTGFAEISVLELQNARTSKEAKKGLLEVTRIAIEMSDDVTFTAQGNIDKPPTTADCLIPLLNLVFRSAEKGNYFGIPEVTGALMELCKQKNITQKSAPTQAANKVASSSIYTASGKGDGKAAAGPTIYAPSAGSRAAKSQVPQQTSADQPESQDQEQNEVNLTLRKGHTSEAVMAMKAQKQIKEAKQAAVTDVMVESLQDESNMMKLRVQFVEGELKKREDEISELRKQQVVIDDNMRAAYAERDEKEKRMKGVDDIAKEKDRIIQRREKTIEEMQKNKRVSDTDIEILNQRLQKLGEESQKMKDDLEAQIFEVRRVKDELEAKQAELKEANDKVAILTEIQRKQLDDNFVMKRRVDEMEEDLSWAKLNHQTMEQRMHALEDRVKAKDQRAYALNTEIMNQEQRLRAKEDEIDKRDEAVRIAEVKVSFVQKEKETVIEEKIALEQQISELEEEVRKKEEEKRGRDKRILEMEDKLKESERVVLEKQRQIDEKMREKRDKEEEINRLKDGLRIGEEENEARMRKLLEREKAIEQLEDEGKKKNDDEQKRLDRLSFLEAEIKRKNDEIEERKRRMIDVEANARLMDEQKKEKEKQYMILHVMMNSKDAQISKMTKKQEQLEKEVLRAAKERDGLKKQIDDINNEKKAREEEIKALNEKIIEKDTQLDQLEKKKNEALKQKDDEIKKIAAKLSQLEDEKKRREEEIVQLKKKVNDLDEEIRKNQKDKRDNEKKIKEALDKIAALEALIKKKDEELKAAAEKIKEGEDELIKKEEQLLDQKKKIQKSEEDMIVMAKDKKRKEDKLKVVSQMVKSKNKELEIMSPEYEHMKIEGSHIVLAAILNFDPNQRIQRKSLDLLKTRIEDADVPTKIRIGHSGIFLDLKQLLDQVRLNDMDQYQQLLSPKADKGTPGKLGAQPKGSVTDRGTGDNSKKDSEARLPKEEEIIETICTIIYYTFDGNKDGAQDAYESELVSTLLPFYSPLYITQQQVISLNVQSSAIQEAKKQQQSQNQRGRVSGSNVEIQIAQQGLNCTTGLVSAEKSLNLLFSRLQRIHTSSLFKIIFLGSHEERMMLFDQGIIQLLMTLLKHPQKLISSDILASLHNMIVAEREQVKDEKQNGLRPKGDDEDGILDEDDIYNEKQQQKEDQDDFFTTQVAGQDQIRHPFRQTIEDSGGVNMLMDIYNEGLSQHSQNLVAICISFLYRSEELPSKYREIFMHLKRLLETAAGNLQAKGTKAVKKQPAQKPIVKQSPTKLLTDGETIVDDSDDDDEVIHMQALIGLGYLAANRSNHRAILTNNFVDIISKFIFGNSEEAVKGAALYLAFQLVLNGASDTKNTMIEILQIDKIRQLQGYPNPVISKNATNLVQEMIR